MESSASNSWVPEPIESVGGTLDNNDHPQVAQLLRLPGRSGLAVNPSGDDSNSFNPISEKSIAMYSNQVGGHRVLMKPKDSSVILKPYDEAEYNFYDKCMPVVCSSLMPFTARCFGEIDVRQISDPSSPNQSRSSPSAAVSPPPTAKSGKYVMLEDLVHGLRHPCILDLKMGLKQRSIRNFSEKKLKSKEAKSLTTTSHKIGFRLGGAQLVSPNDMNSPIFYNKYFGRLQDTLGTYAVLKSFFDPVPPASRSRVIESFIKKLSQLDAVIKQLRGFRFWSGSLLVIYDPSSPNEDEVLNSVTVKMIDFANYTVIEYSNDYDREYVFGIQSLLVFLNSILNHHPQPTWGRDVMIPDVADQDRELAEAATAEAARKIPQD